MLVGCVLPWFRAGGSDGIPPISGNAFEGPGSSSSCRPSRRSPSSRCPTPPAIVRWPIDRWWAFAAIAAVAAVALVVRVVAIASEAGGLATMLPDRAPGLWLTAVGVLGLLFAAADMYGQRRE